MLTIGQLVLAMRSVWTSVLAGVLLLFQEVADMKLEITRALFLVLSLGAVGAAVAAWQEPGPKVVGSMARCTAPVIAPSVSVQPSRNDLLLLMFGLSQGMRASS